MTQVKFNVLGDPKGKGRPVFSRRGKYVSVRTPEDTVSYENLVKIEYRAQTDDFKFPDTSFLGMEINAYYSIPKSTSKKKALKMLAGEIRPTKKPDIDNVVKIIADGLNQIAYHDDTQITDIIVRKRYSDNPRVEVTITDLSEEFLEKE